MRIVLSVILSLLLALPALAEQSLRLGYIGAPLSYSSLTVLKEAYARLGYRIEPILAPGARSLADTDKGLNDGEVHRIKGIESQFPNLVRVDVPINFLEGILVSLDKQYDITTVEGLRPYRVVVRIGNRYAEELTRDLPNVTRVTSDEKMAELLMNKRVDFILTDRPWATSQMQKPGREDFVINEPPLISIPLYHYLHKSRQDLIPQITPILRSMQQIGESELIRQQALEKTLQADFK